MHDVVIINAVRTAIGKIGGALKDTTVEHLASSVIRRCIKTIPADRLRIDEVILGHGKQSSDTPNLARVAALYADLPVETSAYTVQRQCGSGLQAIIAGAQAIRLGDAKTIIAGGAESMSTAPYYLRNARYGYSAGNGELFDPNTESQPKSQPVEKYGRLTMGMTAENLADKYAISRNQQDEFAYASQCRAYAAISAGRFKDEILPFEIAVKGRTSVFDTDEHPRKRSQTHCRSIFALHEYDRCSSVVSTGRIAGSDGTIFLENRL